MLLISPAEPSSLTAPPVQSTISTLNNSPALTSATDGISGCHLLCSGCLCCHGLFFKFTFTTTRGLAGAIKPNPTRSLLCPERGGAHEGGILHSTYNCAVLQFKITNY